MTENNHTPLISVITPCYNQGEYLSDCLDCLLAQTYSQWECQVIDDGSSDNSLEIAQDYANRDSRIRRASQPNQGPSAARNNAVALTHGEYILPLDADDMIDPSYIEKTLLAFQTHPEVKLVYTRCAMFGAREGEMHLRPYSYTELMRGNIISNTSLYRRSNFLAAGGYDVNMRAGWEDWEFYLSLLGPEDAVYQVDEMLYFYRQKPGSRDRTISPEQARELRRFIYQKHPEDYQMYFEDPINLAYQVKMLEREVRHLRNKDWETRIKRRLATILAQIRGKNE
jgi:glycosyltransferase involved in cell wall biosynthesis